MQIFSKHERMRQRLFLLVIVALVSASCNSKTDQKVKTDVAGDIVSDSIIELREEGVCRKYYSLDDITIVSTQKKGDGKVFYCTAELLIQKKGKVIDSIRFSPEPVGGSYGVSPPVKISKCLLFTKHGDYDGRTIIINANGELFNIRGGVNYCDLASGLLFTIHESDLMGFSFFDLKTGTLLFEMSNMEVEPLSFHKAFDDRYFILCLEHTDQGKKHSIWEIELELERVMQVDVDTTDINSENMLKTWVRNGINCECKN